MRMHPWAATPVVWRRIRIANPEFRYLTPFFLITSKRATGASYSFRRNVQEHQNLVKGCKRSPPVPYGHKASCPGGRGIGQRQTRKDSPRPKRFEIAIGQHTPRP